MILRNANAVRAVQLKLETERERTLFNLLQFTTLKSSIYKLHVIYKLNSLIVPTGCDCKHSALFPSPCVSHSLVTWRCRN